MFKELDMVKAKKDLSETVHKGTIGTIVMVYTPFDFEVEFFDNDYNTLDLLTVNAEDLEKR